MKTDLFYLKFSKTLGYEEYYGQGKVFFWWQNLTKK